MTDQELERTLESARRAGPTWNAGRQQQLKWAVMARLDQPRRRRPLFVLALGCFAAAVIGVVGWRNLAPSRPATGTGLPAAPTRFVASATPATLDRPLSKLADGSSIVLDGPSAILKKTAETADEVAFQLEAGGAHFEVAPRPSRIFRVHSGPVTVQVIGTRFHVQRQNARSQISVDRGKVLVSWWGGSQELTAGQEGTFPPGEGAFPPGAGSGDGMLAPAAATPPPAAATPPPVRRTNPMSHRSRSPMGSSPSASTSGSLSSSSRVPFAAAGSSIASSSASHVESTPRPTAAAVTAMSPHPDRHGPSNPEAIFSRADRARSEGKPDLAVAHLREIVDRYPGDPHAPMAAFTVGRLLLESLGKPRQAALAFGQARALANGGPLGEDALAREVEALHVAGDSAAAHQRADLYRQTFPNGPRLHTVMRFGGLRATP